MTYKLNRKSSRSIENQKPESGTITVAGAPYESGPDPEFRDLPQPLPPGFLNLGNTCYINVTLQCLFTVHPLLQWLLKGGTSSFPPNQRLTDSLSALVAATFRRKCKSELQKFRDLVGILHPEFKEAREQDAQEFLLFLLNRLHEENVLRTGNSEVQRIFAGEMRTSVACSHCWVKDQAQTSKEKTSFFKGKSTSECPAGEVFLSLSLPIPLQEEQIDGATLGADPRHLRHRVVLNELIQQPTPSWRQRRLSFDSKTTIESVYKQVDALVEPSSPQLASSASQSSYARMAAVAFSSETAEFADATSASGLASSTSLKTPFLLVQATASGFGAWFLDETGLGANLVDGLDLEAICGPLEPSNLQTRQDNFLYGDSLFLVHLKNSLTATMVDDYRNSCTENMEVDGEDEEDGMVRILVIHVTESGKQVDEEEHGISDTYRALGENAGPAPKFRRFSPPLLISVRSDIQFDELRRCAAQTLSEFLGCPPLDGDHAFEDDSLLEAFFGLRFWIVDAGPGEACEIRDQPDSYPLLHPTVDLSSVPVPSWILPASSDGSGSGDQPKLLRLLAVWPTAKFPPFHHPSPIPYPHSKDTLPTASPSKREKHHHFNGKSPHSSSARNKRSTSARDLGPTLPLDPPSTVSSSTSNAEFTLSDCFKAFTECERPADEKGKCACCHRKTYQNLLLLTKLLNAPNYLLLHLNRFVQTPCTEGQDAAADSSAWSMRKIYSLVDYPIDGLDISSLIANKEKSSKSALSTWWNSSKTSRPPPVLYDLVAVCNHKGQLDSGHYTAICRNLFTNQWWHYSDQKVVKVSADQVVQASAYILFYRKRNADDVRMVQQLRHTLAELARESLSTSPSLSPVSEDGPTTVQPGLHPATLNSAQDSDAGGRTSQPHISAALQITPADKRHRGSHPSAVSVSPQHVSAYQRQHTSEGWPDQPNVGDNGREKQPPPPAPKPRWSQQKFTSAANPPSSYHGIDYKFSDQPNVEASPWMQRDSMSSHRDTDFKYSARGNLGASHGKHPDSPSSYLATGYISSVHPNLDVSQGKHRGKEDTEQTERPSRYSTERLQSTLPTAKF